MRLYHEGDIARLHRSFLLFITVLLCLAMFGARIGAAPSGPGRIAFISERSGKPQIYIMNADGSNIRLLIDPPGRLSLSGTLAFSRDGRKLAFRSDLIGQCCQLFIVNSDGSALTRVTRPPSGGDSPTLSPDGQRVAFVSGYRLYYSQIFLMNLNGSNLTRLTNLSGGSSQPAFSPDGRKIAFVSGRDYTSWGIYVMNVDGSNATRLTHPPGVSVYPAFSPEGKIAFATYPFNNRQDLRLYIMNPDGSDVTPLTDSPVTLDAPVSFSLDGRKIALTCGGEVCVMNADGSDLIVLTSGWAPVFIP